ncbi:zinc ABC transporter substrate-binding protein [Cognatiyoonia sp.]|uniref:zinc ABC transporter substrate-binding protein n=1 Tax=Cognatiyoonia sp. TaxID=2211652 RepID=UPI003F6A52E1
MFRKMLLALPLLGVPSFILADVPSVATDILPVHSLVSQVMDGVGEPSLILPPGASPHGHTLRPSEARSIREADVVFWIGASLTPWLEEPLETLGAEAQHFTLMREDVELTVIALEDGHEDHSDHDHGDADYDPHGWLDPDNAMMWLTQIAEVLSALDPENADDYAINARIGISTIEGAVSRANAAVDLDGKSYIAYHDAFAYFDRYFGLTKVAAVTPADAREPSPSNIIRIRGDIEASGAACFVADAPFDEDFVSILFGPQPVKTVIISPLGLEYAPGPSLYPQMITNMAAAFGECLS